MRFTKFEKGLCLDCYKKDKEAKEPKETEVAGLTDKDWNS